MGSVKRMFLRVILVFYKSLAQIDTLIIKCILYTIAWADPYVGNDRLIKIPHSAFVSDPPTYTDEQYQLQPNKEYHFAVSLFDPYTLRTFNKKPDIHHPNGFITGDPHGHSSLFSPQEYANCIVKPDVDNQHYKYAGMFYTGPDKKILWWQNWSGHFMPAWIGRGDDISGPQGQMNGEIFQSFWHWTHGKDWSDRGYATYFVPRDALRNLNYVSIITSISLIFNMILFTLLMCAICSLCVAVYSYFIHKIRKNLKQVECVGTDGDLSEV